MRRIARKIAVLLVPFGFIAAALIVPPPPSLLKKAVVSSSGWLLDDAAPSSRLASASVKLARTYVDLALAAYVDKRVESGGGDAEVLARVMSLVRGSVLTADHFHHTAKSVPALLTGFGYCDQLNGSVGAIAARRFARAQIFALYDSATKTSPHTIGRVWSKERDDWLYFDAFFDPAVLFTKNVDGTPNYVSIPGASGVPPPDRHPLYSLPGFVLAEYGSSFASHLIRRAMFSREDIQLNPPPDPPPAPANVAVNDVTFRRVSRAYLTARLEDALGDAGVAKADYAIAARDAAAASDSRAAELARAAAELAKMEGSGADGESAGARAVE